MCLLGEKAGSCEIPRVDRNNQKGAKVELGPPLDWNVRSLTVIPVLALNFYMSTSLRPQEPLPMASVVE